MAALPELPDDAIYEILTRISLEDMDACKRVCREWKEMLGGLDFMSVYCERTKNLFGFFIQSLDHNLKIVSKFVSGVGQPVAEGSWDGRLPRGFRVLASCNGILCCKKRKDYFYHRYYICKPTTKQFQEVPEPHYTKSEAIGMVVLGSTPLRYKIFSVSKRNSTGGNGYQYLCEEFDSDVGYWYFATSEYFPRSMQIIQFTPCIFVHGSFHWLCIDNSILAYNINELSFHRIVLPNFMRKNYNHYCKCLVEYKGQLGLCLTRDGNIENWVHEGRPRNYWRRARVIDIGSLKTDDGKHILPCGFSSGDTILLRMGNEVVFFNIQDSSFRTVNFGAKVKHVLQAFPFRSDWKPWIENSV